MGVVQRRLDRQLKALNPRRLAKAVVRLVRAIDRGVTNALHARLRRHPDVEYREQMRGLYRMAAMVVIVVAILYAAHHPYVNLFPSNR